jgi:MFS family permease
MMSGQPSGKPYIFFGWYVLSACFIILFFQSGARYAFSVMFKPMLADLGWNRTSLSGAYFLNMTFFALTMSIGGRLYDRYGPKWVILISTIFMSAGYVGIAFIDTLWEFYICYGLLAAIGFGGASIPLVAALMSNWFEKRRGLAISLAISGNCIGQFLLVPVFTAIVSSYDWRISYALIGLIMLVVNTVLCFTVIRGNPYDFGIKPYGSVRQDLPRPDTIRESPGSRPQDLGLKEALRTHSFWLFLIAMSICGSGDFLVAVHLVAFLTDIGIPFKTAGNMLALLGLLSLGGILAAGPASDRIGSRWPIALTFVLRFMLYILILKYPNKVNFYIFALLFGFTFLITAPLTATLMGKLYGLSHVGLLSGFVTTVHHLTGGFWAYMAGMVFDRTGSYRLIFVISAAMCLIAATCALLIKEKRHGVSGRIGIEN